jgi:serine/threonine-protein kinase RsbW
LRASEFILELSNKELQLPDEAKMAITLEIQSKLDQVRLIRAALTGILEHLRITDSDVHVLELAVAEIVNNCVEHGYRGAENEQIRVHIEVNGTVVQVDVIDHAPPFPAEQRYRLVEEPDPLQEPDEEWSMRGHGLQIVRQIVDSVVLKCGETQNVLTMFKKVAVKDGKSS